jgi:hypothetical protein
MMYSPSLLLLITLFLYANPSVLSLLSPSATLCRTGHARGRSLPLRKKPSRLILHDRSATAWFTTGDSVVVTEDVMKSGENIRGSRGRVIETWEKCEVDPTCCCAEQVDRNMAVRVEFPSSATSTVDATTFTHYFAEAELLKVENE